MGHTGPTIDNLKCFMDSKQHLVYGVKQVTSSRDMVGKHAMWTGKQTSSIGIVSVVLKSFVSKELI